MGGPGWERVAGGRVHSPKENTMSSDKQFKATEGETPFTSDLDRNPGIGQSGGGFATGEDPDELMADNTEEGEVENGAGPNGEAIEGDVGRTNK